MPPVVFVASFIRSFASTFWHLRHLVRQICLTLGSFDYFTLLFYRRYLFFLAEVLLDPVLSLRKRVDVLFALCTLYIGWTLDRRCICIWYLWLAASRSRRKRCRFESHRVRHHDQWMTAPQIQPHQIEIALSMAAIIQPHLDQSAHHRHRPPYYGLPHDFGHLFLRVHHDAQRLYPYRLLAGHPPLATRWVDCEPHFVAVYLASHPDLSKMPSLKHFALSSLDWGLA